MPHNKQIDAAKRIAALIAPHLQGDLSLELWNGEVVPLGPGARDDIRLVIRSPAVVRRLLLRPSLMSIIELYASGALDIIGASPLDASRRWDHLKALHLTRNIDRKAVMMAALPFLTIRPPRDTAKHTYDGVVSDVYGRGRDDQAMIRHHYDVSNAFYELFLDPEMVYSSAYFETPGTSLEQAQITKLDRICRKLRLAPGKRLFDIGCGWGGLVCYAARHFGAEAHGVTLSKSQFEFVQAKIAREGLGDRVRLELRDYRSVEPRAAFDAIAQIEMFEHLGLDNHDDHFHTMHRHLKVRGTYLHQASVRRAPLNLATFRAPTAYMKFITRYIFPGGELDHIGMTCTNLERHGFEVHDVENMREHFELTCRHWAERLWANRDTAQAEVGDQRLRIWLLFLSLCARAFERGPILVFQTLATKREVGASGLPLARADWFRPRSATSPEAVS
jgi:cyclopropane-fatty-acyl-phospholipid synthase